jgi:hypothetical protein
MVLQAASRPGAVGRRGARRAFLAGGRTRCCCMCQGLATQALAAAAPALQWGGPRSLPAGQAPPSLLQPVLAVGHEEHEVAALPQGRLHPV